MNNPAHKFVMDEEREQDVADYLSKHADFFQRWPAVLARIELSHRTGNASSLIERQVRSLRTQVEVFRNKLNTLISVARENEQIKQRVHRLTLSLMEAIPAERPLEVIEEKLHRHFRVDAMALRLFDEEFGEGLGETEVEQETLREFIELRHPRCGRFSQGVMDILLGPKRRTVRSTAVIPLRGEGIRGLLVLGSTDESRFPPGVGVEYLQSLGEFVSKVLEVAKRTNPEALKPLPMVEEMVGEGAEEGPSDEPTETAAETMGHAAAFAVAV